MTILKARRIYEDASDDLQTMYLSKTWEDHERLDRYALSQLQYYQLLKKRIKDHEKDTSLPR